MRLLRAVVLLALILVVVLWSQTANIIPHSGQHKHGGFDEVGTATPGPNVVPKTGSDNFLAANIGGTGAGAFTQGSVVFAGASGVYTENNAGLFFETGTGELGIGTADPHSLLHIRGDNPEGQQFIIQSSDPNWHGRLGLSVGGGTIGTLLSSGGLWSITGTTFSATKDFTGAFPTATLFISNEFDGVPSSSFRFVRKAGGSTTTDGVVTTQVVIDDSGNVGIGLDTAVPDELLHVGKAVDGSLTNLLLENLQAHAAGSTNETAEIRFSFGGDNDVARIVVGKLDDYDPGPAENDSFMAIYTDRDGTPRQRLIINNEGMRLDQSVPNFTNDIELVAGDDVDDLVRILLRNNSRDVGWNIVFDQTFAAKEFIIQDESGANYFTISQNFGTHAFLQPNADTIHTIFFGAGDNVDDDVRVLWQNNNASSGYAWLWDQSADSFIIEDHAGVDYVTVPSDGGIQLHDIGAKPTCNAAHRGTTYYDAGAAAVADTFEVCLKNAADAYNWRAMATP